MSDVCLVLEGTYPYVRGGVSSWVHDIISEMPDIKFSILSIMPQLKDTREIGYDLPNNVESLINIHLHDHQFKEGRTSGKVPHIFDYFNLFFTGIDDIPQEDVEGLIIKLLKKSGEIDPNYAFSSWEFWRAVRNMYEKSDTSISFLDFFWNYRFTYLPLVQLLKANIPPAPLYHTISTGYAGVMAVLAKVKFNSNMIVTEHGIYTKERRIEIAQAEWLYEKKTEYIKATAELGYFKDWWMRYFGVMSKLSYSHADIITTLYEGNRQSQIKDGADPNKTSIIPNGVDLSTFNRIAKKREKRAKRRTLAFVGRVVPIKDVKTLIKACKIIVEQLKDVQILLIGPQDEETEYYQECSVLIKTLGLEKHMVFTGHVDIRSFYPNIDLLLLTSISEAQPLVILEGAACGIPSVATDVGSCRQLLEGESADDRALGKSGIVVQFHSPEETAAAALKLLLDDKLYLGMSEAGIQRTRKYYDRKDMILSYRNLYEQYI